VVTGIFTCYTHVYMKVLNCGLVGMTMYTCLCVYMGVLHMGSMLQYISGIYIGVFSFQPRDQAFISVLLLLLGWAEMKFFCRYTNHECID